MNKSRHFDGFVPVDFIKTTLAQLWNEGIHGRLFIFLIFKNISGFAIKDLAYCSESGKADSRYFVVFDFGEINVGDSYALGKLVEGDFSFHHHSVKSKYDPSHSSPLKEVRQRRFQALHREQRTA